MKVMRFFSKGEYQGLGQPTPAKKFLAQWYKDSESDFKDDSGTEIAGLKKCIPFLDVMISGYMLTTPADIFVSKNEDGGLNIRWNSPDVFGGFISERPYALGEKMPRPAGHLPNHLAFKGFWGFKTPKGYSLLISHPFNRFDLPFTTTSGLVDADEFSTSGNIPFFVKEDFVGVIPAGTPFAQLIPVKRDSWIHVPNDSGIRYLEDLQGAAVRSAGRSYKKQFWQRKDYK